MALPYINLPGAILILAASWLASPVTEASAAGASVDIATRDCKRLMRQAARNDPNYRPGVDVRGRRVAPADIKSTSKFKTPDVISFGLNVDLRKFLNLPADSPLTGEASLGKIEYDIGRNRLTFNGEVVGDDAQNALAARCAALLN